jgi:acetyl esterase
MPVDPSFAALLADKRNELRPPPPHVTLAQMRDANKAFLAQAPRTPIHSVEDRSFQGSNGAIGLRIYRPSPARRLPVVVFMHGGGFVMGDLDSHDSVCHRLAFSSGAALVAVDYRRAPESPFPGPIEDCHAALGWVCRNAEALGFDADRLALCGDSAGANLAAATALRARARGPSVRHLALLYPMIDPACNSASMLEFARGHLLLRSAVQWSWGLYNPSDVDNPEAALLRADLAGLPPTTVATAEFDPLRDEGELFAQRLREVGVPVVLRRYAGMIHGFVALTQFTPIANQALDEMAADLEAALA